MAKANVVSHVVIQIIFIGIMFQIYILIPIFPDSLDSNSITVAQQATIITTLHGAFLPFSVSFSVILIIRYKASQIIVNKLIMTHCSSC